MRDTICLNDQEICLERTSMHVAPGGSTVVAIVGPAAEVAAFLELQCRDIALGICYFELIEGQRVRIDIYYGSAEHDAFIEVLERYRGADAWELTTRIVEEGQVESAYTLASRKPLLRAMQAML